MWSKELRKGVYWAPRGRTQEPHEERARRLLYQGIPRDIRARLFY